MPAFRIGFGSDFTLANQLVGIGTTTARKKLEVDGVLKGDFNVSGVSTLTVYGGFASQKQNVSVASTIGFSTSGVGTFVQVTESETGYLSLVGEYNTVSEDIIVDEGRIFEVSVGSTVSPGTLESVSIQSHFSVPNGGISSRPNQPTEGMVRFNDDLNTLEFYNGIEWRQFTVSGASGRGVFGGDVNSVIDFINISTLGNAQDFGTMTLNLSNVSGCSSNIRGVFGGGTGPYTNNIDYITIASKGNAIFFGTLSTANRGYVSACSSSTRGVFGGGYTTSPANATVNVIDYIHFSTLGNAIDFGDLFTGRYSTASFSSPTRGVWAGGTPGTTSIIDAVTIASTGNAVFFGDLVEKRNGVSGCSSSTRGVSGGGRNSGSTVLDTIDYITIASFGNAINFGSLTQARQRPASCSSSIRGVWSGGGTTPGARYNIIDYVTISTTGNAQDFGDLTVARFTMGACSDSHGGLGGF